MNNTPPSYDERRELICQLTADLGALRRFSGEPIYRRLAIRVGFSLLESVLYCLKHDLLEIAANSDLPYQRPACEVAGLLTLLGKRIGKNGEMYAFNPTMGEMIKAVRRLLRELEEEEALAGTRFVELMSRNPEHFQSAVAARDRLTHPKSPDDLVISEEAVQGMVGTLDWMSELATELSSYTTPRVKIALSISALRFRILMSMGWLTSKISRPEGPSSIPGGPITLPPYYSKSE